MPRPCGEALGAKLRVDEQASARVCARRRASLWVAARDRALRVASAGMTGLQVFEDAFPVISERTSLELVIALAPALALASPHLSERARRWFVPVPPEVGR